MKKKINILLKLIKNTILRQLYLILLNQNNATHIIRAILKKNKNPAATFVQNNATHNKSYP